MKEAKFIRRLILFLLPVALLLGAIEFLLSRSENSYTFKRRLADSAASSTEIIILGSSHSLCGINPALLSRKAINLAERSQPLYYDSAIASKYLPQMKQLKLVILPIDYFSLFFTIGYPSPKLLYYQRFWDIGHPDMGSFKLSRYSLILMYKPKLATDIIKADIAAGDIHACFGCQALDANGYFRREGRTKEKDFARLSYFITEEWKQGFISEKAFSRNTVLLDRLLGQLEQKNIRVLLLSMPMHETLRARFDTSLSNRTRTYIGKMIAAHPNCNYTDYSADPRFGDAFFFDPDHLNTTGAEKFTRIINAQADSLLR